MTDQRGESLELYDEIITNYNSLIVTQDDGSQRLVQCNIGISILAANTLDLIDQYRKACNGSLTNAQAEEISRIGLTCSMLDDLAYRIRDK